MAIKWEIHALEFGNCNCGYSCPCQFNALPTYGDCRAIAFFRVDRGHYGAALLDGLNMAYVASWPGPVHEGKGAMQPIIDARADAAQRQGLLSIMTGKDTEPMSTMFSVFTTMCDTVHDPVFTEIAFDADMAARRATCEAAGVASGRGEPILNPVTGAEHQVGLVMPKGFEFRRNEVGRGWSSSQGAVPMTLEDSYAHWCEIHMNQNGVMEQAA